MKFQPQRKSAGAGSPRRRAASLLHFSAAIAICLSALLAGCGSAPQRPAIEREPPAPQARPPAPPAGPSRGAYYKDDGPGDNPPADLDRIADPEPRIETLHRFANNPYSVFGQDYVPMKQFATFRQRGLASWYGRRFHGQPTASGEPYDMYAMSAAHPTLPIPSYARVTNLQNGLSVIVRVNDRGPFHSGRVIDLSYTAAYKLAYSQAGSAPVEVELILPVEAAALAARPGRAAPARAEVPRAADADAARTLDALASEHAAKTRPSAIPVASDGRGVYLQLGAFSGRDNAESFRARLALEFAWISDAIEILQKDGFFRLHMGPYRDRGAAAAAAERIRKVLELRPIFVTR